MEGEGGGLESVWYSRRESLGEKIDYNDKVIERNN